MRNYRYIGDRYNIQRHMDNFKAIGKFYDSLNKKYVPVNDIISAINSLADFIQENSSLYKEQHFFNELVEETVKIIEAFNNGDKDCISINTLVLILKSFYEELDRVPVNVFFYGKDKYHLLKNSSKVKIKTINNIDTYINSYEKKHDMKIDILIVSEETSKEEIDFRCNFSDVIYYDKLMNLLFSISEKIYYSNYDYNYLMESLQQSSSSEIETIIVGNSYPLTGIDVNVLNSKSVNLALSSQDLYYSYKLAETAIKNNFNIKKCIIGAGYYLVNHDLSKSKNEDAVYRVKNVYYPILRDKHNSENVEEVEKTNISEVLNDEIISFIFDLNFLEEYFKNLIYRSNDGYFNENFTREMNSIMKNITLSDIDEEEKWKFGKIRANQHNKLSKNTETSKEYSSIFNKFMNFLRENDVEPIVVVFPNTKYYSEYLNEIYEKEFYKIISNKKEYRGLKLIDFSKQDLFSEEDFIDFDHMSKNGAVKLTRELNKLI